MTTPCRAPLDRGLSLMLRWRRRLPFRTLWLISLVACISMGSSANAACIPTTVAGVASPLIAGTSNLQLGSGGMVNGTSITISGTTSLPVSGTTSNANAGTLPALTPATFPAVGTGTVNSSGPITAGSYGTVNVSGNPTVFSGGTYYINTLNTTGPIQLAAGTYYINTLNLRANLTTTGAVQIFIGSQFNVANNGILINSGGSAANLRVNLYVNAEFDAGKNNVSFTGLIYSPSSSSQVQFENNAVITGAIITAGQIDIGNNATFNYGATVQAQVASIACPSSGPNHYELSLPTRSINCLPTAVTVTACADASSPCTSPFAAASGTTASLATNGGTLGITPVTFGVTGIASTTLSYPAAADGATALVTLSGEQTAATNPRQCCPDGVSCVVGNSCSTTFNTAGFIFSGSAGGGEVTIPVQVAGQSSGTYYLRAIKSNTKATTATQACEAALTGTSAVNFAYECNNPASCYAANLMSVNGGVATTIARNNNGSVGSYLPVNMTFDGSGNAPFTFNYSDVGQVTLHASKAAGGSLLSALTGSSNAFVTKPGGFVLSVIQQTAAPNLANPAAADAAGTKFVKAGEAFSATVTAVTSTGSTAYNYGQENAPREGVKLTPALVTGLGLSNNPTLGGAFGAFTNGVATGSAFTWNEVGIINLTPSVGGGNYLGAGDVTGTTTGNIGRFYPDHFAISAATLTAACTASTPFSYFGQDGFTTAFTLTAQNAANGTTQNYSGAFAKLDLTNYSNYGFTAVTLPAGSSLVVSATAPSGTWTNGVASVSAKHQISRPTALTAETSITVSAAPTDGEVPAAVTATAVGSATNLRFGRLKMQNIYGSEKLPLAVPLQAQYWTGSFFTNNADDSCTAVSAPLARTLSGSAVPDGLPNLYFYPLVSGKNELLSTDAVPTLTSPLSGGQTNLQFSAPLKRGWLDVILNVPNYLTYNWGNCSGQTGTAGLLDDFPCARATFGVYGAKSPIIYRRENY